MNSAAYNPDRATLLTGALSLPLEIGGERHDIQFIRPTGDFLWVLDQLSHDRAGAALRSVRPCIESQRAIILLGVAARERLLDDNSIRFIEERNKPWRSLIHQHWSALQLFADVARVASAIGADTPQDLRDHRKAWGLAFMRGLGAAIDGDSSENSKHQQIKALRDSANAIADGGNPFDAELEPEMHQAIHWARLLGHPRKGEPRDVAALRRKLRESLKRYQQSLTQWATMLDRDKRVAAVRPIGGKAYEVGIKNRSKTKGQYVELP